MTIKENLKIIQEKIEKVKQDENQKIQIIAVTKTKPITVIQECYEAGIRSIGENKIQEAIEKLSPNLTTPPIKKRFIGHLQSNKISKCLPNILAQDAIN